MSSSGVENTMRPGAILTERAHAFVQWAHEANAEVPAKRAIKRLRTSARRVEAGVCGLRSVLRNGESKRLLLPVRELRRIAGGVRDADVISGRIGARLKSVNDPKRAAAGGYLLAHLGAQRERGSAELADALASRIDALTELPGRLADCVKPTEQTQSAMAGETLRDRALLFAGASEQNITDLTLLHELRKDGKRLRYTVELFEPMLPPMLAREVLARLADFQQRLGTINDAHAQAELISRVLEREDSAPVRDGLVLLRGELRAGLDREHCAFVRWWWDVGAAQQLLGCAHELSVMRQEARVA